MRLLVIRHGIAMDRDEFAETGEPDDRRPLTSRGSDRMERAAAGLGNQIDKIDLIATSPLIRATQTADIVAAEFSLGAPEVTGVLVPEASLEQFEEWCSTHADKETVAVVGHEPHLSSLVTWLLAGGKKSRVEMKKGGACLIDFESAARRDSGTMLWLLTPRQLRRLAK